MNRLGIKVTEAELKGVRTQNDVCGMWFGDGTPIGDPFYAVDQLVKKYNLPADTGLDLKTGEFVSP